MSYVCALLCLYLSLSLWCVNFDFQGNYVNQKYEIVGKISYEMRACELNMEINTLWGNFASDSDMTFVNE